MRFGSTAALIVALSLAGPAMAEPVRFCFARYPPFTDVGADEQPAGLSIDALRDAARRVGDDPRFEPLPWARCLELVRTGLLDAAVDSAADRAGYAIGRHPTTLTTLAFFVSTASPLHRFQGLPSLDGLRVGLARDYAYTPEITRYDGFVADRSAGDDLGLARLLAGGRVDAVLSDLALMSDLARSHGFAFRALEPVYSVTPLYPAFSLTRRAMAAHFDSAIAAMLQDGTLDRLYRAAIGVSFGDLLGRMPHTDPVTGSAPEGR